MPIIQTELVTALKRKRGEENLTINELSKITNVSRWTLDRLVKGQSNNVHQSTIDKLNKWLYSKI